MRAFAYAVAITVAARLRIHSQLIDHHPDASGQRQRPKSRGNYLASGLEGCQQIHTQRVQVSYSTRPLSCECTSRLFGRQLPWGYSLRSHRIAGILPPFPPLLLHTVYTLFPSIPSKTTDPEGGAPLFRHELTNLCGWVYMYISVYLLQRAGLLPLLFRR